MRAAEEMTSLSNLFRSERTVVSTNTVKAIGIRSLEPETPSEPREISLDSARQERDRMLAQATEQIEREKTELLNMRQTAEADIEASRAAWLAEKEQLQQQAYEEGFQAGFEDGRMKAYAEMEESIQSANETTKLSYQNATQYLLNQERVILDLAIRSAEQIIGKALAEDEEAYLSIVKKGLKEAQEMKDIKLFVPLEHFKLITDHRAELASIFPPEIPFLIFVNEDFDAADCYIETNHGRIVASVDEQLNELKEQLVEILESGD